MNTYFICLSDLNLSEKVKEIQKTFPNVRVVFDTCQGLEDSSPVVYDLLNNTFYGNVSEDRLVDVLVQSGDDLQLPHARLYDVEMLVYKEEQKFRKGLMAFKNRLIVSLDIEPKTIREFIKTCSKEANCNEYELLNTCKIALINTIYGPSCEALIYELGKEEALKRINLFLLQNKYRY